MAFFSCLFLGQAYFDGDLLSYFTPARQFLKDNLAAGHIPLWNPYLLGGQPFFPDPGAMTAYPLNYLTLLFPTAYGLSVFQFLHFFIAALGMRYWLKTLALSEEACWIGAVSFASSGFFWSEIIHPPCLAIFAWLPWWMGSLEQLARRPQTQTAFKTGLVFSMIFLAGYFQMALAIFYLGLGYLIFLSLTLPDRPTGSKRVLLYLAWGGLPLWILGIPFLEFMGHFDRWNLAPDYQTFNADFSLNPSRLYQFFFPGNPLSPDGGEPFPLDDVLANAGYVGIAAPLLLPFAFQKKRRPLALFLSGAALLSLLVGLGKYFPLHEWVCHWVPGFRLFRAPFRLIFIYTTCLSALVAIGFEGLLGLGRPTSKFFKWGKGLLLLSIPLSLLLNGWHNGASRIGPASNLDLGKDAPLISKIFERVGHSRVFVNGHIPHPVQFENKMSWVEFPASGAEVFGLRNVGGNNPLSLMKWGDLKLLPHQTLFRLMALQGFVTGIPKDKVPDLIPYSWGSAYFYEYKEPLSYVYAPRNLEVIPKDGDQLNAMGQPGFNPYQTVVMGEPPTPPAGADAWPPAKLNYQWIQDGVDDQRFEVRLDKPSWVVFSEVNYPGWKAWVDGVPQSITTSNYVFRGMELAAGDHQVRFQFDPILVRLVFFGLCLWMLTLVAFRPLKRWNNDKHK